MTACQKGHADAVQAVLEWTGQSGEKVDATVQNNEALISASEMGHMDVVKLLLEWTGNNGEKVNVEAQGNRTIFKAFIKV